MLPTRASCVGRLDPLLETPAVSDTLPRAPPLASPLSPTGPAPPPENKLMEWILGFSTMHFLAAAVSAICHDSAIEAGLCYCRLPNFG